MIVMSIPQAMCGWDREGSMSMWSIPLEPFLPVLVRYGVFGCMSGMMEWSPSLVVPYVRMLCVGACSIGVVRCSGLGRVC